MEAVALLEADDLTSSSIPVGQVKLLLHAVQQTFGAATEPASKSGDQAPTQHNPSPTSGDTFVNEVLQQVGEAQDHATKNSDHAVSGTLSWQDPQIYLKSLGCPRSQTCHYDIVDFIDMSGASLREEFVSGSANGQLIFKSGPAKPKLDQVNQTQWSIANLAIMYRLLQEGTLEQASILDYLSYSTRLYQLLAAYDQSSVFFYDCEYRRLQHTHSFRWGTDVPHLQIASAICTST